MYVCTRLNVVHLLLVYHRCAVYQICLLSREIFSQSTMMVVGYLRLCFGYIALLLHKGINCKEAAGTRVILVVSL